MIFIFVLVFYNNVSKMYYRFDEINNDIVTKFLTLFSKVSEKRILKY